MEFPINPIQGQEYTVSNKVWVFNGKGWALKSTTVSYSNLDEKPSINSVELVGDKTAIDLGLAKQSAETVYDPSIDGSAIADVHLAAFASIANAASFTDNAIRATYANKDSQGNQIDTHYATQAELQSVEDGASKTGHTHTEYSKEPLSITYADLYNLTQTSGLTVGQRYIINDYQTIHEQPNTGEMTWDGANYITQPNVIYTAPVEQLLVEALSTSKLANECKSLEFPQDIIYYNINNDQSVVPGCSKGYIYRRIDTELNNDIDMDFRKAKIRAYLHNGSYRVCYWVQNPFGYGGSLYFGYGFKIDYSTNILYYQAVDFNSTNKIDTIIFKDATDYKSQNITNNKFYGNSSNLIGYRNSLFVGNNFYYNTIGNSFYNNTIGNYFNSNIIGNNFYSNTIGNDFYNNTIGYNFYDNTIGDSFYNNTIGTGFYFNTIGYNFSYNTIGDSFSYNTIGFGFYSNTIGTGFSYNTIVYGFNYNTIGNYFSYNTIGYDFNNNTIGNDFNSNTIGDSFRKNNIESNVSSINFVSPLSVYVYLDYPKYIFNTSTGTTKLRYYDGNNTLQITNANA